MADLMPAGVMRVSAARDGWRRAGRVWTAAPQDVAAGDLTEAQWEMLRLDPNITLEAAGPAPDAPPAADALADAIRGLPPEAFAQDGKPRVDALSAAVSTRVSAAERDAAWDLVLADKSF